MIVLLQLIFCGFFPFIIVSILDVLQLVWAWANMSYIYVEGIPGRRCAHPARSVLIVLRCTSFIIFQFSPSAMVAPQRKPSYLQKCTSSTPPQWHRGGTSKKTIISSEVHLLDPPTMASLTLKHYNKNI